MRLTKAEVSEILALDAEARRERIEAVLESEIKRWRQEINDQLDRAVRAREAGGQAARPRPSAYVAAIREAAKRGEL